MIYIELADIIGIAIITYASILTKNNFHLRRDIRLGFHVSGMALAILYCLDLLWCVLQYTLPISSKTDFILNLITCIIYLMIPVALSTFFTLYTHKRRRLRHYIGIVSIIILALGDIINIFIPIFFYHKESQMIYLPPGFVMHVLCFVAFMILLIDMILVNSFDYEDSFLAGFVGVTMFIGLLASWINYDLKTLWVGMGISYLLMYLSISELYNKKDVITELPNRNAYEKAMSHNKNFKSIVMIDMNKLKLYNDTMGHAAGDNYIYATAKTLAAAYSSFGKLYRVGGDEFCLVSEKQPSELSQIADKLLKIGKCYEEYGDFPIDFAYGIAEKEEGESASDVYKKADRLMYENKKMKKDENVNQVT